MGCLPSRTLKYKQRKHNARDLNAAYSIKSSGRYNDLHDIPMEILPDIMSHNTEALNDSYNEYHLPMDISQVILQDATNNSATNSAQTTSHNNITNRLQHNIAFGIQHNTTTGIPQGSVEETIQQHTDEQTDVFSLLEGTNITKADGYCCCEVDWSEKHLQVEPGLNILATCKNIDCICYLKGVICPRGLFQARKGYCSFDREIHGVTCPICKQRIAADISFGVGFYRCEVVVEFMLTDGIECQIPFEALYNTFVITKCNSYSSGPFLYMEMRIRS